MITSTTFRFYPSAVFAELSSNSIHMSVSTKASGEDYPCRGGGGCSKCIFEISCGQENSTVLFDYLATLPTPPASGVKLTISHSSHPELFL